ncbi:hypothetical protein [Catellatospora sp. NPDC049609]|uniref:hypothetical protein n=1 Tax=Catellatospora sp. NPDC049609 TaxID=3155505 RepID=UPI0034388A60
MSMTAVRRNAWWLVPELLALALVAVLSLVARPAELDQVLAERVSAILTASSPAEHHAHGHDVAAEDTVLCTAETMGTEPAGATRVADVRVVYAYFFCAAGEPGQPWDFAARISGPVVVELTEPPAVRIAEAGLGYQDRVRAMLPDRYEDWAFSGFRDKELPTALQRRYLDEVAGA